MVEDTIRQLHLRIRTNAFARVLERFVAYLGGRGNAPSTLREYVHVAEHFGSLSCFFLDRTQIFT